MILSLARKFLGSANDRLIRSYRSKYVEKINALEPEIKALSDADLRAQTPKFRERIAKGESLESLLPEAFATVREAARRVLSMRHFDVQLIGGIVLHHGMISEMRTGEGKTLVATLPSYLNALSGKGVHVVTVNDYLARRDAGWMGKVHEFLGLSVGVIVNGLDDDQRQQAYAADITYGTNNEFGFDYLRDNMKYSRELMVQRPFNYAIVDEVDSILIDEARTPLIISGPAEESSEMYKAIDAVIPLLAEEHYEKEEKSRAVSLTEPGMERVEILLKERSLLGEDASLYDIGSVSVVHHVNQALKAHKIFARDVDYIVKDNKVIIIDEFTGRMMEGRRYSEGLHQALEAKENVKIQQENQTLASITFQNYFRLYPKLSGMTGTAMTEAQEFRDIYNLEVVDIPTNVPVCRTDSDDEVYRTAGEKYGAIIELIEECSARKQPVLVGTVSIEKSEYLSELLKKKKIPHQVLNARYHEKEAHIIAQAGRPGAVTIATNMAGRGTDIMLGGNPEMLLQEEPSPSGRGQSEGAREKEIRAKVEADKQAVIEAGGLFVIGTERHESRRIDNQLRGRSGRQGDPGASRFFLSLEDDLLRIFGSERMDLFLRKMGLKEGEKITHPWMNKALEKAQQKVEARNYEIRKNLLKFDDVMNDQRKVIYEQRITLMEAEDVSDTLAEMREEVLSEMSRRLMPEKAYPEQWDAIHLTREVYRVFGLHLPVEEWAKEEGITQAEIVRRISEAATATVRAKEEAYSANVLRFVEKRLLLQTLDHLWKEHLLSLDHLRQGINLRAYGQRDPLNEYKQEAFGLFERMLSHLREAVTERMAHLEIQVEKPEDMPFEDAYHDATASHADPAMAQDFSFGPDVDTAVATITPLRTHIEPEARDAANPESWGKVRRNEPCPCGSGKKYKQCHGALLEGAEG